MHQGTREGLPATFKPPRGTQRSVVTVRPLTLSVSLSLIAAGALGLAASQFETARAPVAVAEALKAPAGARLLVRGLLGEIRTVGGGAGISSIGDCTGRNMTVFFEQAPAPGLAWRLVAIDARV